MKILRFDDPGDFLDSYASRLLSHEASDGALTRVSPDAEETTCWAVEDAGEFVIGAVLRHRDQLLLSGMHHGEASEQAIRLLAGRLRRETIPGWFAPERSSARFMASYGRGQRAIYAIAKRIYHHVLTELRPRCGDEPAGGAREARAEDAPVLIAFLEEYQRELLTLRPFDESAFVEHSLAARRLHVWEDHGDVVAMASCEFERSSRSGYINHVFVPRQRRRGGYATALMRALSSKVLNTGRVVMLATDVANSSAQRVYENLGYEVVCEMHNVRARSSI